MCERNEGAGGRSARILEFIRKAVERHGDYYDYSLVTDHDYRSGDSVDNLQWVHEEINRMNGTMNNQEFLELCKRIVAWDH
jgi:hypothetical protein